MPRRHPAGSPVTERATTCPNCQARFRVTQAQLIQRGGLVRCGDCRAVFDGLAALVPAPTEPAAPPATAAPATLAAAVAAPSTARATAPRAEAEPQGGHALWWAGAGLLVVALIAQAGIVARPAVADWHPWLRTALEGACRSLGCTVGYRSIAEALKLDDAELIELPGRSGQVSLQARIRNVADRPQAYPPLELTLRDATGNREVRRVLVPADYLGTDARERRALGAGDEALVNLRLEARGFKPTGYVLTLLPP